MELKSLFLVATTSYLKRNFGKYLRSKTVSEFNSSRLYEIYAYAMESLA